MPGLIKKRNWHHGSKRDGCCCGFRNCLTWATRSGLFTSNRSQNLTSSRKLGARYVSLAARRLNCGNHRFQGGKHRGKGWSPVSQRDYSFIFYFRLDPLEFDTPPLRTREDDNRRRGPTVIVPVQTVWPLSFPPPENSNGHPLTSNFERPGQPNQPSRISATKSAQQGSSITGRVFDTDENDPRASIYDGNGQAFMQFSISS
ncbi:hypothetical protein H6P81_017722 [Aristolochia fimbriata]|uniref:Uncharacterized protein n=1 Tax=Aristolochia fimbriata TaxID=158543 RepID=A0AAV7DZQ6_ARIFI|nr:hypothetical protein H6P81_017722 [Aristolochia fimbriata]